MGLDLPLAAAHPLRQPAGRPEALSRCLAVITRAIQTDLAQHAGLKATDGARTGIVTLIQRFGSTLNLNVHLHMLVLDGVYSWDRGRARFHRVGAPKSRCQAIEVAIGMTIPISAIEIMRMRLIPAAFQRATALASTFVGDDAIAGGWLDEIVEADQVVTRAQQVAQEVATTVHAGAHVATKLKARQSALDAIRAGIDGLATEFTLS